jgi:hypothetical protein
VTTVDLSAEQRFELLKLEMELVQGVFDKYDAMIFQSRSWFVTIWTATLGLAFTARLPVLMLMAAGLAILYWVIEGLMRHQYWHRYVVRYRALRDAFNDPTATLDTLSIYDLTHKYGASTPSSWARFKNSFGKLEPILLYFLLGAAAILGWWLVSSGVVAIA